MAKKTGTSSNDIVNGTGAADELAGLDGNDVLRGRGGADKLFGGNGADRLEGGAGNDYLDGGTGDDDLRGGAGNDTYIVDHARDITRALADAGLDTVGALISYTLGAQQEALTLLGKARLNGTGNARDNFLTGNSGANLLVGLGGNDVLDGGKGRDVLRGGAGNDLYFIDRANEIEKGRADPGNDQVKSTVSYTLGGQQESLVLLGKGALSGGGNAANNFILGNDGANLLRGAGGHDVLVGGAGADRLFGAAGNDDLRGGAGIDRLHGGAGNDSYTLDHASEIDKNEVDPGIDTVAVNFNYTLGAQQENLVLYRLTDQTGPLTATGNALNNFLGGTELGGDALFGGDGKDTLNGGAGDDHLVGQGGDDTYFIDHEGDITKTDSDPGKDRVNSFLTYTLGEEQEELVLLGSANLAGTGNSGANFIIGNSGANELRGGGGVDEINGGGGADQVFGEGGNDLLHYRADADVIDGGADGDLLGDTLLLKASNGLAGTTLLDLTAAGGPALVDLERVRFATGSGSETQSYTLKVAAADVLDLSSTSNMLRVDGEAGDTVQLSGTGWVREPGLESLYQSLFGVDDAQVYNNVTDAGTAQVFVTDFVTVALV